MLFGKNHGMNRFSGVTWVILVFCFALTTGCQKPVPPKPNEDGLPGIPRFGFPEASGSTSIFQKVRLQESHASYQTSYLNLIKKIGEMENKKMTEKEKIQIFTDYSIAVRQYREVLKKIGTFENDGRQRCFSIMRSLVSAVSVYDKLSNKKMFRFDGEKLLKENIIKEVPHCPRDGEYFIFYKDGRRLFRCSLHGTLKQN